MSGIVMMSGQLDIGSESVKKMKEKASSSAANSVLSVAYVGRYQAAKEENIGKEAHRLYQRHGVTAAPSRNIGVIEENSGIDMSAAVLAKACASKEEESRYLSS